jgi:hypothetical protein
MVADMLKLWYLTSRMQGMTGCVPLRRLQQIDGGTVPLPLRIPGNPPFPRGHRSPERIGIKAPAGGRIRYGGSIGDLSALPGARKIRSLRYHR